MKIPGLNHFTIESPMNAGEISAALEKHVRGSEEPTLGDAIFRPAPARMEDLIRRSANPQPAPKYREFYGKYDEKGFAIYRTTRGRYGMQPRVRGSISNTSLGTIIYLRIAPPWFLYIIIIAVIGIFSIQAVPYITAALADPGAIDSGYILPFILPFVPALVFFLFFLVEARYAYHRLSAIFNARRGEERVIINGTSGHPEK